MGEKGLIVFSRRLGPKVEKCLVKSTGNYSADSLNVRKQNNYQNGWSPARDSNAHLDWKPSRSEQAGCPCPRMRPRDQLRVPC